MVNLKQIEDLFKELNSEDKITINTYDSTFEKEGGSDDYKSIISLHSITGEDFYIVHTKFIFRTNDKYNLSENYFNYLYDLNCDYKKVRFTDLEDLKIKIKDILESKDFGEDIKYISDFIEAPSMFLNFFFKKNNITDYSVFNVEYQPKFKISPCESTSFDFDLNINNMYDISFSVKKSNETDDSFLIYFYFMGDVIKEEVDSLKNLHMTLGYSLLKILNSKLKNK